MTEKDLDRIAKYGYFSGYANYRDAGSKSHMFFWYKPLWEVGNRTRDPLTYHDPNGFKLRPNHSFVTDFGSVPFIAQAIIPRIFSSFRWRKSYTFHDSGFMEKGLWYAEEGSDEWSFKPMTRRELDNYLPVWIRAEGGGTINSAPIWFGVKLGSWSAWGKKDLKK
jgi:hypothetical protein